MALGGINVARTCHEIGAKWEATFQGNGFLVRLRGGSGIVCTKFEQKDQQDNQIKSKQMKTIITSNTKTKTQDSFHSFIDIKIGYHFSDYKKRIHLLISRFLLSFSLCYTTVAAAKANKKRPKRTSDSVMKVSWFAIELCLITCLHVTKHHLFTQNSNLISRSINITRSLHVKRPTLNIITWLPGCAVESRGPPGGRGVNFNCLPQAKCFLSSPNIIPFYNNSELLSIFWPK